VKYIFSLKKSTIRDLYQTSGNPKSTPPPSKAPLETSPQTTISIEIYKDEH